MGFPLKKCYTILGKENFNLSKRHFHLISREMSRSIWQQLSIVRRSTGNCGPRLERKRDTEQRQVEFMQTILPKVGLEKLFFCLLRCLWFSLWWHFDRIPLWLLARVKWWERNGTSAGKSWVTLDKSSSSQGKVMLKVCWIWLESNLIVYNFHHRFF